MQAAQALYDAVASPARLIAALKARDRGGKGWLSPPVLQEVLAAEAGPRLSAAQLAMVASAPPRLLKGRVSKESARPA